MTRVNGIFDGKVVLLKQPVPAELKPNTAVEVLVPDERDKSIQEMLAFLKELWTRPVPEGVQPVAKRWTREELHDRR
jgi:hypothetical protein